MIPPVRKPRPSLLGSRILGGLLAILAGMNASWGADPLRVWLELRDKGPFLVEAPSGAGKGTWDPAWESAPVHAPYLDSLRRAGFAVSAIAKWQNKVSGTLDPRDLAALRALPFVRSVEELPRKA